MDRQFEKLSSFFIDYDTVLFNFFFSVHLKSENQPELYQKSKENLFFFNIPIEIFKISTIYSYVNITSFGICSSCTGTEQNDFCN